MSEKPFDHYLLFETLDFVMDDDFQDWTRHPTPEREAYWQALLIAFPQKGKAINTARQLIQQLRVNDWHTITPDQLQERFQKVLARIDAPVGRVVSLPRQWWAWVAAVLLVGLLGWSTYQYGLASHEYQTAYSQQQRVSLDDQTTVTLAANSQLRVPGRWLFGRQREVWLTGEAYFDVARKPSQTTGQLRNFVVHARDMNVEVLGTRFNVNTHRGKTTVLLDEGKIKLTVPGRLRQSLLLRPGQTAELPADKPVISIRPTTDPVLANWRNGRLTFRNASLAELRQRVQEVYGLTLVFDGDGWEDTEYTGELPFQDVTLSVRILAETFGADVTREKDRLILRKSAR